MSGQVSIFGGAGFVGRYITNRLARQGWRVRVASRNPEQALFVSSYGEVGQVVPVFANVRDDESVGAALKGADAVVNCVGILAAHRANTFDAVQASGAGRIARLARAQGVTRMVHVSAIGADAHSDSAYARTKAEGEAQVRAHMPDAMVLRPSIVFGPEDQFFNRFARMARLMPVVPVVGMHTRFQPVFVDDIAAAAVKGISGASGGGVYELGGPDIESFATLMRRMLQVIVRRGLIVPVPFALANAMAAGLDMAQTVSGGLFRNAVLTRDQVRLLRHDVVVGADMPGFEQLGIVPTSMDAVLETYLWCFRRGGQYARISSSDPQWRSR